MLNKKGATLLPTLERTPHVPVAVLLSTVGYISAPYTYSRHTPAVKVNLPIISRATARPRRSKKQKNPQNIPPQLMMDTYSLYYSIKVPYVQAPVE